MGVIIYVEDSDHRIDMHYSGLGKLKRLFIELTWPIVEAKGQDEAAAELRKWIAAPAPLSRTQAMQLAEANGFPAHMALDPVFAEIMQNVLGTINVIALPRIIPRSLHEAELVGVHNFVTGSNSDAIYSKGQCVDIVEWLKMLMDESNNCDFGDFDGTARELVAMFEFAIEKKQCVRLT